MLSYDRIVCRMLSVDSVPIQLKVRRLLQVLAYTKRALSIREVLCAIAVDADNLTAALPRPESLKLLEFCKPLVQTTSSGTVEFIHFTALE
jgi:hypothetical protein